MKALSVRQPWASMIASGEKTIETRVWSTEYRGPLLICATKKPVIDELPVGIALCIVELVDCRPMTEEDQVKACCEIYPRAQSFVLDHLRSVEPFPVKGQLGFFDVDVTTIEVTT